MFGVVEGHADHQRMVSPKACPSAWRETSILLHPDLGQFGDYLEIGNGWGPATKMIRAIMSTRPLVQQAGSGRVATTFSLVNLRR